MTFPEAENLSLLIRELIREEIASHANICTETRLDAEAARVSLRAELQQFDVNRYES